MELMAYLRELNLASTALRMFLAVLFGGLIGLEREHKRLPAGFRTYMLVCLGATTAMLLNQYQTLMLTTRWAEVAAFTGNRTDVSRFGAQVISGISFLGAGTILVTGHQEVKGVTTAAGLWASACMGLAIGAGFYECTIAGFAFIFFSVKFFPKIENFLLSNSRNLNLYVEFDDVQDMTPIIAQIKGAAIGIYDIELRQQKEGASPCANLSLRLPKRLTHAEAISALAGLSCIHAVEEI